MNNFVIPPADPSVLSFEITGEAMFEAPPFADGCPHCRISVRVIPIATYTAGDTLHAFYNHGRCGKQWHTAWGARYSHDWHRVQGDASPSIAA